MDLEIEKIGLYFVGKGYKHSTEMDVADLSDLLSDMRLMVSVLKSQIAAWDRGERDGLSVHKA